MDRGVGFDVGGLDLERGSMSGILLDGQHYSFGQVMILSSFFPLIVCFFVVLLFPRFQILDMPIVALSDLTLSPTNPNVAVLLLTAKKQTVEEESNRCCW